MKYISLIFIVFFLVSPLNSWAQERKILDEDILEQLTQEVSETSMSPFCPGRTISACPSPQARDLRTQIKKWFTQGYSKAAVQNQLLNVYGQEVTGKPRAEGFGWMAWAMPIVFVLLSLGILGLFIKKLGMKGRIAARQSVEVDAEMMAKIEQELKERA